MNLYGITEIAKAMNSHSDTVSVWRSRGYLPEPDAELAMGPVWSARRIEPWIKRCIAYGPRRAANVGKAAHP